MAQLSDCDRLRIWQGLMRWWSGLSETVAVNSADLRAAVNATDAWIDDNQVAFNTALPDAAKDNLTTNQKTLLFCAVALARVDVPMLRRVFGGVD